MKHLFFILSQQARSFANKLVTLVVPIRQPNVLVRTNMSRDPGGAFGKIHRNAGARSNFDRSPVAVRGTVGD